MEDRKIIIKIKSLEKTFNTKQGDVKALENINLDIYEGEIFGIIGLSGAGKSTLVRCINYLETPTCGEVIFDGNTLSEMSEKALREVRQSMGMIFQQFNLLMQRTALDNICFPLEISGMSKTVARERARELLKLVGLIEKEKAYPAQLSGGQQQRVAIARALATNPKVLLCDEATSALDPTTTSSIIKLLREINKQFGITIIVITHQMHVIEELCQRVAIIDNSNIVEVGIVSEVFAHPQTNIARELIYSDGLMNVQFSANMGKKLRIIFDGISSYEPVISNAILECKTPLNILFADIRNIDGRALGQMVIQLPDSENSAKSIIEYLSSRHINFVEVDEIV